MKLTLCDIAQMIDLSAVRMDDGDQSVRILVDSARRYQCHLVTTLPSQTLLAIELLRQAHEVYPQVPEIGVSGNVGFPSGGQTTAIKVAEARELLGMGCTELDMVINLSGLISGRYFDTLEDIRAVVATAEGTPVKVILECHYLSDDLIRKACDLCIQAGAAFIKTGTGWAPTGATLENIALIKTHVGEAIGIKASGGIRQLEILLEMYRLGAQRFGIGLRWVGDILAECERSKDGFIIV
jgi:deoxyribose-phosphate aldolase